MILFLINEYHIFDTGLKEKRAKSDLRESLISKKSRLEQALYSRIYFTKSVAAYVAVNSDITEDAFNILAKEFISGDTVISTMSLAKDCVIGVIYPLEDHESAIGLKLLEHPKRREMVEKSIITRQTFIAGPVELVEGGIAFISYTPVFSTFKDYKANFWGVTDIVLYRDKLFNEVGLSSSDKRFKYAMKGIDGTGNSGETFWGDSTAFDSNPVTVEIQLPTGTWTLAATPHNGWTELINQSESLYILLYLSAFIISILVWLWSLALVKIRTNEKELKALFASMEDLIIVFDKYGEYLKVAPTNEKLLVLPREEIIGKKLHDIFDKSTADFFLNAIIECLQTKQLVVIDYKLNINNRDLWFRARLSYLTDDTITYLAHDNTKVKNAEFAILESEKKLIELNSQKDKLFSIIAHDLKNPLGSFRQITKLLYDEYDSFDEKERKEFLQMIKESSIQVYELLENLLEWSRLQRNQIIFKPVQINLSELVNRVIELFKISADKKNIRILNNISSKSKVWEDPNALNTILRNLISNAIKFTPEGGEIEIGTIPLNPPLAKGESVAGGLYSEENDKYITIYIRDSGIGMSRDILDKLFRIDESISTRGTAGEKGTGLGLILCKEFIEKHGGKIWVESEVGKGSTFYFTVKKSD